MKLGKNGINNNDPSWWVVKPGERKTDMEKLRVTYVCMYVLIQFVAHRKVVLHTM